MAKEPDRAPPQTDPAEGSRSTIEHELERQDDDKQKKSPDTSSTDGKTASQ